MCLLWPLPCLLCSTVLIVGFIGGTPESQREFIDTLSADISAESSLLNEKRKSKAPPIANHFALGYTYRDVLDADQEGMAAPGLIRYLHR